MGPTSTVNKFMADLQSTFDESIAAGLNFNEMTANITQSLQRISTEVGGSVVAYSLSDESQQLLNVYGYANNALLTSDESGKSVQTKNLGHISLASNWDQQGYLLTASSNEGTLEPVHNFQQELLPAPNAPTLLISHPAPLSDQIGLFFTHRFLNGGSGSVNVNVCCNKNTCNDDKKDKRCDKKEKKCRKCGTHH